MLLSLMLLFASFARSFLCENLLRHYGPDFRAYRTQLDTTYYALVLLSDEVVDSRGIT